MSHCPEPPHCNSPAKGSETRGRSEHGGKGGTASGRHSCAGKAQPRQILGTSRGTEPVALGKIKDAKSHAAAPTTGLEQGVKLWSRSAGPGHGQEGAVTIAQEPHGSASCSAGPQRGCSVGPQRGAATHREAPAEEGPQEGGLACAPGSQHFAEEDVPLGLAFLQVDPLLPGHWHDRGWVSERKDRSRDRRGGHGRTREGLCL